MLVINCKDVSSNRFPWPPSYFVWYHLILLSCCLKHKTCGAVFNCLLYVGIHVDPIYWITCQHLCHFYAHMINVQLFSALSCSVVGIIILPKRIGCNPQYDCYFLPEWPIWLQFLYTSAFVDDQPWSTSSINALRYSFSRVTTLISSAIMQPGISMHDSIALIVMCMSGISSYLFVLWLYLDSLSSSGHGL